MQQSTVPRTMRRLRSAEKPEACNSKCLAQPNTLLGCGVEASVGRLVQPLREGRVRVRVRVKVRVGVRVGLGLG